MCKECRDIEAKKRKKKSKPTSRKLAAPLQDMSLPVLQELAGQGYDRAKWRTTSKGCMKCRRLNNKVFKIKQLISGLYHEAPLFERSHPGDYRCYLEVTGPRKPMVKVNYTGIIS